MTGALTSFLAGRTPRERVLLAVMAAVAAVWIAVSLVWQPLTARRAALNDQIARHDRALAVLAADPVAAVPVASQDDRPLNVILTETAAQFQLVIRRLEPEGAQIRLVLEEAPFDAVILALEALQREHGLRVASLDLGRRPAPGVVNATLVLER